MKTLLLILAPFFCFSQEFSKAVLYVELSIDNHDTVISCSLEEITYSVTKQRIIINSNKVKIDCHAIKKNVNAYHSVYSKDVSGVYYMVTAFNHPGGFMTLIFHPMDNEKLVVRKDLPVISISSAEICK